MENLPLFFFGVLLFLASLFLMALILVQRGKGGGLTGALGGMGGASAFGSKAGDAFTKITVITSVIWIGLCMLTIALFNRPPNAPKRITMDDIENIYKTNNTGSIGNAADPGADAIAPNGGGVGGGALPGEGAMQGEGVDFLETDEEAPGELGPAIGAPDEGSMTKEDEGEAAEVDSTEAPGETGTPDETEAPGETETPAETPDEGQGN